MGRIRRSWVLAIILTLFVALSILYNVYTPIFESPDELQHTAFVAWLDDQGALPVVTKDKPGPVGAGGNTATPLLLAGHGADRLAAPRRGRQPGRTSTPTPAASATPSGPTTRTG